MLSEAEVAANVEREPAAMSSEHWLDELTGAGVPAASVLSREHGIADPFLVANGFSHVLEVPGLGSFRVVRSYSAWEGVSRRPGRNPVVGRDAVAVLSEAGVSRALIDELIARKAASAPAEGNGRAVE